ncbi:MAG: hypothetical protein ACHQHO_02660 [Solirubrobacterales bacterium]
MSILDCGSRDNLPDYVRLADELHIDALVITDGDATKAKENDGTAKNVAAVEAVASGRMVRFQEDIETALKTTKRSRDNLAHLLEVIGGLDLDDLAYDHEISVCVAALMAFCVPPRETDADDVVSSRASGPTGGPVFK